MKLKNPPVTQTWIGFKFAFPEPDRIWNLPSATEFLSRFVPTLNRREAIFEARYVIRGLMSGKWCGA